MYMTKGTMTMKKLISCLLVVLLLASLSVAAFADGFVGSVVRGKSPVLIDFEMENNEDGGCGILITPWDERETLPDKGKELEEAYEELLNMKNLADANEKLAEAAGDQTIAVSEMFDARLTCDHDYHLPAAIKVRSDSLDGFVGLIMRVNDEWLWVEAEVEGDEMTFHVDELCPFAIIGAATPSSVNTGETVPYGFIAGTVVFATAAAWLFIKSRKAKAE